MNIITQRDAIKAAISSFTASYSHTPGEMSWREGKTRGELCAAMRSLDPETCTVADIDAITGNSSWARLRCDECGTDVGMVVEVGQLPDYESATAHLCHPCLLKALALAEQAGQAKPVEPEPDEQAGSEGKDLRGPF